MGWVKDALKELSNSGQCQIRPFGGSMKGRIESGQLVTLKSIEPSDIQENDVVLVHWKNNYLLHLVLEINNGELLIGNNLGKINGWVSMREVVAKVIEVTD